MANHGAVAARLSKVIDVCSALHQGLTEFEAVVLRENEALSRSDLAELEAITDEKVFFGDCTSRSIVALMEAMELLAKDLGAPTSRGPDGRQLTHFVDEVQPLLRNMHPNLEPQIAHLSQWAKKLKMLRVQVFAQIETNAYLVQRLLDYHRQTYAFWQTVARDSESGYSRSGKTKYGQSGPSKSLLTVRT
jgi:hypothetical protein